MVRLPSLTRMILLCGFFAAVAYAQTLTALPKITLGQYRAMDTLDNHTIFFSTTPIPNKSWVFRIDYIHGK